MLRYTVEAGSNFTKDHSHTRPADILVPNWSLGKPAAFNVSVMSPLNSNVLFEAGLAASQAARANHHGDANLLAFSSCFGAWGTEAMESFSLLASCLATSSNRAKAEVLAALYGRLNLNLVRANAKPSSPDVLSLTIRNSKVHLFILLLYNLK